MTAKWRHREAPIGPGGRDADRKVPIGPGGRDADRKVPIGPGMAVAFPAGMGPQRQRERATPRHHRANPDVSACA
ncbi:hypothetical protein [Microbacterium oleivorans]|uniref:hypothetical protein n=1 Tax=Microbacterium oleivorans TaxID=273677 RepID=UPI000978C5F6|nr:hypothetical protein [Microbacterium oleivorans]